MNSWQVIQTCRLTWPLLALLSILSLHTVPAVGERSGSRGPPGTDPAEPAEPAELQHDEPEGQKAPSKASAHPAVAHPHERKDLEYSALEKYENDADDHLKAIEEQMEGKLKEKVDAAHGKHNAYINKVWDNHMGLDEFNDSLDKFRAAHAGKDESGMAEMRDLIDKGMTEVKLNTELGRKFQAYNAQRLYDIGKAHGKQNQVEEETLKSNRALGVPETHPHYKDFAELHKKFPAWIGVEPAKVESSQSRPIEDDISEKLDEETLMKAKKHLLSKAGIGRAAGPSSGGHEDELSEDTLKKAMKQIESGYEKERQEKAEKDLAKQDEVDAVEEQGQGESEDEPVKPAEVDSVEKLRQETAEKELATQDEVGSAEKLRQKSAEKVDSASNDEALLDAPSMEKKPTDSNVVLESTPNGAMVKRHNEGLSSL